MFPVSESVVTGHIAPVMGFLSEDELPAYCSSLVTHPESICTTIYLAGNADSGGKMALFQRSEVMG